LVLARQQIQHTPLPSFGIARCWNGFSSFIPVILTNRSNSIGGWIDQSLGKSTPTLNFQMLLKNFVAISLCKLSIMKIPQLDPGLFWHPWDSRQQISPHQFEHWQIRLQNGSLACPLLPKSGSKFKLAI
jgi:hypothetical protein